MKNNFYAFIAGLILFSSIGHQVHAQFAPNPNFQMPGPGGFVPGMIPGAMPAAFPQAAMGYQPIPGAMPIGAMPDPSSMVMPAAHFGGGGGPGCGACDGGCGGTCEDCCSGGFCHGIYAYGEFLYLRARDAEVAWVAPANGALGGPGFPIVQIGQLGVLDMDYQPGWRVGLQVNLREDAGVSAQYTMFESTTNDFAAIAGPNILAPLVVHNAVNTAGALYRQGTANYQLSYDIFDVDYHGLMYYDCDYQVGYLIGVTAVQSEAQFRANFVGGDNTTVVTDIDFTGVGLRFGVEGEGTITDRFRFYGKGIGSLVAGEYQADYDLDSAFDPNVVNTGWQAGRIVGIWNLELGLKWVSRCNNYSANLGYLFSAWTNTVQTDQWIQAVVTNTATSNTFINLDDTMTFDGLVARFEARF